MQFSDIFGERRVRLNPFSDAPACALVDLQLASHRACIPRVEVASPELCDVFFFGRYAVRHVSPLARQPCLEPTRPSYGLGAHSLRCFSVRLGGMPAVRSFVSCDSPASNRHAGLDRNRVVLGFATCRVAALPGTAPRCPALVATPARSSGPTRPVPGGSVRLVVSRRAWSPSGGLSRCLASRSCSRSGRLWRNGPGLATCSGASRRPFRNCYRLARVPAHPTQFHVRF